MTEDLKRKLIDGTREQSKQKPVAELDRARDACLLEIQDVIAKHWPLPR